MKSKGQTQEPAVQLAAVNLIVPNDIKTVRGIVHYNFPANITLSLIGQSYNNFLTNVSSESSNANIIITEGDFEGIKTTIFTCENNLFKDLTPVFSYWFAAVKYFFVCTQPFKFLDTAKLFEQLQENFVGFTYSDYNDNGPILLDERWPAASFALIKKEMVAQYKLHNLGDLAKISGHIGFHIPLPLLEMI